MNFGNNEKQRIILAVLNTVYAIAVIAVVPTDRASFVYSYMQTRLKGQYNGK